MLDAWKPLCTRVDFSYFTHTHDGRGVFPYTKSELAYALLLLIEFPELVKELEDLDEKPVLQENDDAFSIQSREKIQERES